MENYQTRVTPEKEAAVKALKDEFAQYDSFIFTDYRGMTVEQLTKIRKGLGKEQNNYRVVKNTYAKIALEQLNKEVDDSQLKGPTGIVLVKGDSANVAAKVLFDIKDEGAPVDVKGGLVDGRFMDAAQIEAYSKLPSKKDLLASLMGTMKAPIQKLAATLLAYQKKMEAAGGAAPEASAAN
ncbi:MAG: 50S ribosomal protein L10 [Sphaerochaetaceae bacterium]|nr:50S ribosomal protein L10 [Spirochaetales bacterium]MDY5500927.1 50S ribosomal protein L10 [Sphaerochaetaceae bacterium]